MDTNTGLNFEKGKETHSFLFSSCQLEMAADVTVLTVPALVIEQAKRSPHACALEGYEHDGQKGLYLAAHLTYSDMMTRCCQAAGSHTATLHFLRSQYT